MILKKKPVSILDVLLILDAFVLGGCVALVIVNGLLDSQLKVYGAYRMAAADTVLDIMDDLLPYYVAYAGIVAVLILMTIGIWVWRMAGDESTVEVQAATTLDVKANNDVWPRIVIDTDLLL